MSEIGGKQQINYTNIYLQGKCLSEFNLDENEFIRLKKKHLFVTAIPEDIIKIKKHWGTYKAPIIFGRILINSKNPVTLDTNFIFHCKIVKYNGLDKFGKKYTNFKLVLIDCNRF